MFTRKEFFWKLNKYLFPSVIIFSLSQLPATEEKAKLTLSDVCGCYRVAGIDNCVVVPNDASLKIKGYSCHLASSFQINACFVFLSNAEAQMSGWCLPLHQHRWIAQSEGEIQRVLSISSRVNHSLLKGVLENLKTRQIAFSEQLKIHCDRMEGGWNDCREIKGDSVAS